ncbi:hypothetical protein T01_4269 [Trichinella spiralis]|uniref:Uncharacterized protein n=1 Tax=Trichinella spiralis TaxID=6334 RepID=A0A0V0Z440_TRISP|nr:hypothetical protein T01_4269 [Trichinella spiralis]
MNCGPSPRGGESVENFFGLSLKIPICYRNRCVGGGDVICDLREDQRSVSEIQLF